MTRGICSFPDCDRFVHAYGLCRPHDQQQKRGRTLTAVRPAGVTISREEAFWSKVSRSGDCWTWTAYLDKYGYGQFARGGSRGAKVLAHRYSWELTHGQIPYGKLIDHMCHNPACVNPAHLRAVSNKQNAENRRGAGMHSGTGVRGVTWDLRVGAYLTYATHNGRKIHGPRFADLNEAAEAAKQLRLSLFTHNDVDRKAS